MLYTNLGRIVVVLVLIFGIFQIVVGLTFTTGTEMLHFPGWGSDPRTAGTPYSPREAWRAAIQAISTGIFAILIAIGLGILTEISRNVRANTVTANEAPARPADEQHASSDMVAEEPAQAQKRANKVQAGWALALLGLICVAFFVFAVSMSR
jgi:hypothetical protein